MTVPRTALQSFHLMLCSFTLCREFWQEIYIAFFHLRTPFSSADVTFPSVSSTSRCPMTSEIARKR